MHSSVILITSALCILFTNVVQAQTQTIGTIYINPQHIFNGETRIIEVFDVNCNIHRGNFSVVGGAQQVPVDVCIRDGRANIRYRNVTNNGPVIGHNPKEGEYVSP